MSAKDSPGGQESTGAMSADAAGGRLERQTTPSSRADIARRKAWARRMILAGEPPVKYGSRAWHALPETDRRRVAGVVLAAECWATDEDELSTRLHREIADGRAVTEQLEREDFAIMAAGVRRLALVPTYAELADRRGQHDRAARAREHSAAIRDGWDRSSGGDAA